MDVRSGASTWAARRWSGRRRWPSSCSSRAAGGTSCGRSRARRRRRGWRRCACGPRQATDAAVPRAARRRAAGGGFAASRRGSRRRLPCVRRPGGPAAAFPAAARHALRRAETNKWGQEQERLVEVVAVCAAEHGRPRARQAGGAPRPALRRRRPRRPAARWAAHDAHALASSRAAADAFADLLQQAAGAAAAGGAHPGDGPRPRCAGSRRRPAGREWTRRRRWPRGEPRAPRPHRTRNVGNKQPPGDLSAWLHRSVGGGGGGGGAAATGPGDGGRRRRPRSSLRTSLPSVPGGSYKATGRGARPGFGARATGRTGCGR